MSELTHAQRSRQWIAEQLDQLGNLRNANARDPSFKHWRQNTLTVLQRIWPRHASRSDRFRRVAFTPGNARPDGTQVREAYARGCAEAERVLRELLEEIDTVGVPEPGDAGPARSLAAAPREDDFPVLELSSRANDTTARREEADDTLRDLRGADALAPEDAPDEPNDPSAPAPPRLKVELTRSAAAAPADAPRVAPPPAAPAARANRPRKAAQKPRLKEMLGLGQLERDASGAPAAPAARFATPAPTSSTPPAPPAPAAPASGVAANAAPPEPPEPARAAPAAGDLLAASPLFALQGRPVQRTSDATEFLEPDAVALATLANDLGRLGVPESERERLRASLRAVAAQIETRAPEWIAIQMLVAPAMGHPELARRLMPILLPWLPRAG